MCWPDPSINLIEIQPSPSCCAEKDPGRNTSMKPYRARAAAMLLGMGAAALSAGGASAQNQPPPAAAATNAARSLFTLSRPTGRFGRTLGLPKDGKDLYIADEDYIHFPLPPGGEAYADVDAMKIK